MLFPFQVWMLYNIRFLITGGFCGDWVIFGGLAAKLAHLAIAPNLATTENIPASLSYGRLVRTDIQERARASGGAVSTPPLSNSSNFRMTQTSNLKTSRFANTRQLARPRFRILSAFRIRRRPPPPKQPPPTRDFRDSARIRPRSRSRSRRRLSRSIRPNPAPRRRNRPDTHPNTNPPPPETPPK